MNDRQHALRSPGSLNRAPSATVSQHATEPDATTESESKTSPLAEKSGCSESDSPGFGKSSVGESRLSTGHEDTTGLITSRFKHVITDEGHAVITGHGGKSLQRCEDEPIHIPGAVQSFGLLVALDEKEKGQLVVRIVSENSHRIIGYTPQELFNLNSFCDILPEEDRVDLLDHVGFVRGAESDPASKGAEVFAISVRDSTRPEEIHRLWCAVHIHPSRPYLIICEFELENDKIFPLVPMNEKGPDLPEDTLSSNPTEEEYAESTVNMSKPLLVLRRARERRREATAMELFNTMSQVEEQLASASTLEKFLKILVGVVKELSGFHRVMVYKFDSNFNGCVITELVDPEATKDFYRGLHFPASDIPKQARELYKVNRVRLLYDRDLETARLVCRGVEDLETPLDLSYSYLRAMSPIHIKYLANMAVRSSMSISINAFGGLWGLIACHSYGPKGTRVSFPMRKMCRIVGDIASRNIERLSYASRLQARKLIDTAPADANSFGYIVASSDDLVALFDAEYGLLTIRGETKIMGKLERSQEALVILEYLRMRKITSVTTSQDIKEDFPDLNYPPGFTLIAGLLLVPLSVGGDDFIVMFRGSQIREVKWAGNPYQNAANKGSEGSLEPRKSFETWTETVAGKCREWTDDQIETAAVVCLVYGKFIKVWRQIEAALESTNLTKLLIANSAHEFRTPLNAIINYLEIALEGALDQETREILARSHSASKSLIYVINDLLDLTKAEEGQDLISDEVFNLPEAVREVTNSFIGDAERKGLEYKIIEHSEIPQLVCGDQRSVRQIVTKVVGNAIQQTTTGEVRVELWLQGVLGGKATVEIVVQDTGPGMSSEELEALVRDLKPVYSDDHELDRGRARDPAQPKEKPALGLEFALVARAVRNINGQLRLKSEEGKGSRLVVQLPLSLPADNRPVAIGDENDIPAPQKGTPPPPILKDEFILIDRGSPARPADGNRKRSIEERRKTLHSFRSGSSGNITSNQGDVTEANSPRSQAVEDKTATAPARKQSEKDGRNKQESEQFQVLIADDDKICNHILKKRLEKSQHEVHGTTDGGQCVAAYKEKLAVFDVVLMDMQMPIVDGTTATKMIRAFEQTHSPSCLSPRARRCGRVPIFAVSATLVERERQSYIDAGFDGWVPKPVDFGRLNTLLAGIVDDDTRNACVYHPGEWERGGWFLEAGVPTQ